MTCNVITYSNYQNSGSWKVIDHAYKKLRLNIKKSNNKIINNK